MMQADTEVHKGLEGVIVTESSVGFVDGQAGRLVYRGYNIETLADNSNYEEVAYLLLYGHLPNVKEFENFRARLRTTMDLNADVVALIKSIAPKAHPMSVLRTVVSFIGAQDQKSNSTDLRDQEEMSLKLMSKLPAIVGTISRASKGQDAIKPDPELSYAANFLYCSTGKRPDKEHEKIMDTCLILHADHGSNASTFSALVTISTLADMYSAVTSAISTLKGPLHGGANELALETIKKVAKPENAEHVLSEMLAKKEKIMGFGHRVYKVYDPRARILKKYAESVTRRNGKEDLFRTAEQMEKVMISKLGEKGIFPNVDFYSGMVYDSLGFDSRMFTPIFALARIAGWTARSLEYIRDNKLFRPKAKYIGEAGPKEYVGIQKR
ncbi:MAG: citrate/2-methylcitrate synthase [Candidatus Thermoplasmatota archaeon]|nr:citrate/2-methylcitrate synthase [Candidatus Thermoplasmatota archaeon]